VAGVLGHLAQTATLTGPCTGATDERLTADYHGILRSKLLPDELARLA
jgi:hypothetical protein